MNNDFLESGLIFAIQSYKDLQKIKFRPKDFALHGDAFEFVADYLSTKESIPPSSLLVEKFKLVESAQGTDLDYCLGEFKKHVLFTKSANLINNAGKLLKSDPERAVGLIINGLENARLDMNEDVIVYDTGETDRLASYVQKKKARTTLRRTLGIPTPFRTINREGMGWMPGELSSLFARTTVGKTWVAAQVAAVAVRSGHRTLFVSPELTDDQVSIRIDVLLGRLEGFTGFTHKALRRGEEIDEESYKAFLEQSKARNFLITNNMSNQVFTLETIQSQVRKYRPELLIVDGLELISDTRNRAVWEKMMSLFYGLKTLCTAQNIACFVTTQALMYKSIKREQLYRMPSITDVAYGQALIRASDNALTMRLWKADHYKHLAQIQKSRHEDLTEGLSSYMMLDWKVNEGIIQETNDDWSFDDEDGIDV